MKIALIHALRHSQLPVEAAFARLWPQAELMNLLDDSLSRDLARDGGVTPRMTDRFLALARYAVGTGADGILFTCSAFGPCIEACRDALGPLPILKPNEAMIEEAVAMGGEVGLLATFAPTLKSMPAEFPRTVKLRTKWVARALDALDDGQALEHDRLVVEGAREFKDCDVIALAQFSLARAAAGVQLETGRPVLTTPDCAVRRMRCLLEQ